jgi:hypothetical protein
MSVPSRLRRVSGWFGASLPGSYDRVRIPK